MKGFGLPANFHRISLNFVSASPKPGMISVPSSRLPGVSYALDLRAQTCTCPDFTEMRANRTRPGELGRLCKHLVRELDKRQVFATSSTWVQAIVNEGYGAPYIAWEVSLPSAKPMLVTIGQSRDWINVFAQRKRADERYCEASGAIAGFGWALGEHRWSYGAAPPGAGEIRPLLKQLDNVDFDALISERNQSPTPLTETANEIASDRFFAVSVAPPGPASFTKSKLPTQEKKSRTQRLVLRWWNT